MSCGMRAHKPLAVVEAKNQRQCRAGANSGRLYADWLEKEYGQRPVILYTNGYDIWLWDDHKTHGYPPRRYLASTARKACNTLFSSVKLVCR